MATYKDLKSYRAGLRRKINAIKKGADRSIKTASKYQVMQAKRLAPRDTGATIRGIRRRKNKKGWAVESWVSGVFKQNMWANQTSPFAAPLMRWNNRKPTIYGDGTHHITGEPRFFDIATKLTRKVFFKTAVAHTRKALRTK